MKNKTKLFLLIPPALLSLLLIFSIVLYKQTRREKEKEYSLRELLKEYEKKNYNQAYHIGMDLLNKKIFTLAEREKIYSYTIEALYKMVRPEVCDFNLLISGKILSLLQNAMNEKINRKLLLKLTRKLFQYIKYISEDVGILARIEVFEQLVNSLPEIRYDLARIYMELKPPMPLEAEKHIDAFLKLKSITKSQRMKALKLKAEVAFALEEYNKALTTSEKIDLSGLGKKEKVELLLFKARLLHFLSRFREAIAYMKEAISLTRDKAEKVGLLFDLANIYLKIRDTKGLEETLLGISKFKLDSADTNFAFNVLQLLLFLNTNNLDKAKELFNNLDVSNISAEKYDEYKENFNNAINLLITSSLGNLNDLIAIAQKIDEFRKSSDKNFVELSKTLADVYSKLGELETNEQKRKEYYIKSSEAYLSTFKALKQEDPLLYVPIGDNYFSAGMFTEALRYYEKYLDIAKSEKSSLNARIFFNAAEAAFNSELYAKANEYVNEVLKSYADTYPYGIKAKLLTLQILLKEKKFSNIDELGKEMLNNPDITPESVVWKESFLILLSANIERIDYNVDDWQGFFYNSIELANEYYTRFPTELDKLKGHLLSLFKHILKVYEQVKKCDFLLSFLRALRTELFQVIKKTSNDEFLKGFIFLADCLYTNNDISQSLEMYSSVVNKNLKPIERLWAHYQIFSCSKKLGDTQLRNEYYLKTKKLLSAIDQAVLSDDEKRYYRIVSSKLKGEK